MRLRLKACSVDLSTGALADGRSGRLTSRELALLCFLSARPYREVSREALLHEAFGYAPSSTSRAVDKTMVNLRKKVELLEEPDHLITVQGTGYRFVPLGPSHGELPAERDPFVGREGELAELLAMLQRPGLVTLKGTGGVGKSRLAVRAARIYAEQTGELAASCDLGSARKADDVLGAVADALGVTGRRREVRQIGAALAARGEALLVLDPAEHLSDQLAPLDELIAVASRARLLLVSRVPSERPAERVLPLEPLPLEQAVALLELRSQGRGHRFSAPELRQLAQKLDGLPLALELAAARLDVMRPSELIARLDQRLDVLRTTGSRSPLGAVLESSWALLEPEQRTALAELSVFRGRFALGAAEAVLGPDALDLVQALERASLLQVRPEADGARLVLLDTVRLYAAARLADLGPGAVLRARRAHAVHYAALGSPESTRKLRGPDSPLLMQLLDESADELACACRFGVEIGDRQLATDACSAVSASQRRTEVRAGQLCREVLALPLSVGQRARIRYQLASALEGEAAAEQYTLAIADAEEAGDEASLRAAWHSLGMLRYNQDRFEEARACFHSTSPPSSLGLSYLAYAQDRYEEGLSLAAQVYQQAQREGDAQIAGKAALLCGGCRVALGETESGLALYRAALRLLQESGHLADALQAEMSLSTGLLDTEQAEEARTRLLSLIPRIRRRGLRVLPWSAQLYLADASLALGLIEEADRLTAETLEAAESLDQPWLLSLARLGRAYTLIERGRPQDALPLTQRALAEAEAQGEVVSGAFCLCAVAQAHLALGDRAAAAAAVRRARASVAPERTFPGLRRQLTRLEALLA